MLRNLGAIEFGVMCTLKLVLISNNVPGDNITLNAGISKIHCTLPPYYIMLVESRQLEKDSYMQGIIFQ